MSYEKLSKNYMNYSYKKINVLLKEIWKYGN